MSSRRLIPSPAELADLADEMLLLNDTIASQARRFEAFAKGNESIDPFDILKEVPGAISEENRKGPPRVIEARRAALADRLRGVDFHDPHGWPEGVADALRGERKALGEREGFNLLAGMTVEDDDPSRYEGGLRTCFAMPSAIADAMAEREKRARLLAEAAGLIEAPEATTEALADPSKGEAASSVLGGESIPVKATAAPEPAEAPVVSSPVDFAGIAAKLRRDRRECPARLVEIFADQREVTFRALKAHVHEECGGESAVTSNVKRTNGHLAEMGSRLRFSIRSRAKIVIRVLPAE